MNTTGEPKGHGFYTAALVSATVQSLGSVLSYVCPEYVFLSLSLTVAISASMTSEIILR